MKLKYKRILLKLSGEALLGEQEFGISLSLINYVAREIATIYELGIEIGIVVGGGNIFRGIAGSIKGMNRSSADNMGMLATVMNSVALCEALERNNIPTRVQSAIHMNEIAEPYILRRAIRHLEKKRIVIFAAGTGNPFFTTDTAAVLRANEIGAEVLFKATKVNGVYDSDPVKNKEAKKYDVISYREVLEKHLTVMDMTAISLAMEQDLPIVVFALSQKNSIKNLVCGEKIGTQIG